MHSVLDVLRPERRRDEGRTSTPLSVTGARDETIDIRNSTILHALRLSVTSSLSLFFLSLLVPISPLLHFVTAGWLVSVTVNSKT